MWQRPFLQYKGAMPHPTGRLTNWRTIYNALAVRSKSGGGEDIFVGDINAKFPNWSMQRTNNSGVVVIEWIAQSKLIYKNVGEIPSFKRQGYRSILDLALPTEGSEKG